MANKKLIVVGGGAAGFFCAINAKSLCPSLDVVIVEKSTKVLSKVKVSGGGRCNATHACFSISEMVKRYPRGGSFLKKAFHHFFTTDTIQWFKDRGVELKTESDGRMFPATNSSQTIIDCFISEINKLGIPILFNKEIGDIARDNNHFLLSIKNGETIHTDYLCIASGGNAKAEQFNWLRNLGHTVISPTPSLFTFNMPSNSLVKLMGIVVENASVQIVGSKLKETGSILITHWGISGPAVLKLSAWGSLLLAEKNYSFSVLINWVSSYNEQSIKEKLQKVRFQFAAKKMCNYQPFSLPERLWLYLLEMSGINEDIRWADLPAKEQNKLIKNLVAMQCDVQGKTTFKEEFVTAGGISLSEVDYNTMQSKIHPNLFFAGEVLDIDGVTGGFNFQNAWTTGFIAAKAIAASASE